MLTKEQINEQNVAWREYRDSQIDEALTGSIKITPAILNTMAYMTINSGPDYFSKSREETQVENAIHDIAKRILVLLKQSHRSEEADRILSFLLK